MDVDPLSARVLAAVAEHGTLDAAARSLHITPSAVSQRLKQLEQQVGRRLLIRSRPVRLTPEGRAVVRFAQRQQLLEHELRADLGLAQDHAGARLTIAVNSDSLATWFLRAVAEVTAEHPVQIELLREDQDGTARLLGEGEAVAAVTSAAQPPAGCSSTALGQLSYRAMAASAWWERWAGDGAQDGRTPSADVLARAPRIDFDRTDVLQAQWLRGRGVDPAAAPVHHVPSTHELAVAVELGMGWAMLLEDQARELEGRGAAIGLGGPAVVTPLYWQAVRTPSTLLDALTEAVVAAGRRELAAAALS